jgi:acyl-coenzyme A thioesterase PaaI-like protein
VEVRFDDPAARHIVQELGFTITHLADELRGWAPIVPEMFVPGTGIVRASILATLTDVASGLLAAEVLAPRVPVTLELDVHLYREPQDLAEVHAVSRMLKVGRSVVVVGVELSDDDGAAVGMGAASFMAAPDPGVTMPSAAERAIALLGERRLRVPFAERARCERREPGVAVLPRSEDGLNASDTVNGGLIALTVEEAVLSALPGVTLASLGMRYLRPVRVGPAIARATVHAGLGRVEVRDVGSDDRLAVIATTRSFDASR